MKRIIFILLLMFAISLYAEAGKAGAQGAYLKMGPGARALGMGSAFCAIADDSTAIYWNVAGISRIRRKEFSTMHAVLTYDRRYNYVGFVSPLERGAWGFGWINAGVDSIERYDGVGNFLGYFDDKENSYIVSYSMPVDKENKYYLGINLKYLRHDILDNSGDSFGADIGFLTVFNKKFSAGISLKNIGVKLEWDTESARSEEVPFDVTLGLSYRPMKNILLSFDIDKVKDLDTKLNFGVEGKINDKLFLRGGVHDGDVTAGVGVKFKNWNVDYAWSDSSLGAIHRISANVKFGEVKPIIKEVKKVTPSQLKKTSEVKKVKTSIASKKSVTLPLKMSPAKVEVVQKVPEEKIINLYEKGNDLLINKKFDEAIEVFKNIIKLDPNYADAYYKIGIAYVMKKDLKSAKEYLKKALKLDPENNYAKYAEVIVGD